MKIKFSPMDQDFFGEDNKEQRKIIAEFLEQQLEANVLNWEKNKQYQTKEGHIIEFDHEVIARDRKEGKDPGIRFEVVSDKLLGKGGQGAVYEGMGVFSIKDNDLAYKQYGEVYNEQVKDFRVVKKGSHSSLAIPRTVEEIEDIGYKPAVKFQRSYALIMKKIGDHDLSMLSQNFCRYRNGENAYSGLRLSLDLSSEEKLNLTHSLIKNLAHQINQRGTVHQDIKPDNIRFSYYNNQFKTYFIDTDNACKIGQKVGLNNPYSSGFSPPETRVQDYVAHPARDVYAMGEVLKELWQDELKNLSNKETSEDFKKLEDLIKSMTNNSPDQRPTIDEVEKRLQQIQFHEPHNEQKELEAKFLNAIKLNNNSLVIEMLKNKQINLNTVNDSKGRNPLSLALERHNRPMIELFLKEGLKPDRSNESEYGSSLYELLFDAQCAPHEKRSIEDRIEIAKLLIKNNIIDISPPNWVKEYPNAFFEGSANTKMLQACLNDPEIKPLIVNSKPMQNLFIAQEQSVLKSMKHYADSVNSEFKKEGFFQRFSQTENKKFIQQILAAFSKYDVENETDPAKIHQKFIELCQLISKHPSHDEEVECAKENMFSNDAQFVFENLASVQYELPKPKEQESQQVADLSNIIPPSDLQW